MSVKAGFGNVSRLFHWAIALLIAANVALGVWSANLPREAQLRETILLTDKSFGLLVIVLTVLRLAWVRLFDAHVDHAGFKPWEMIAARIGHGLLYGLMLAMPLSGVLWSLGSGRDVSFFHLITLPQVVHPDPSIKFSDLPYYRLGKFLHVQLLQWMLYAAFALHMAGVVKHQLIDGDRAFPKRMWGRQPT